VSRTIIGTLGVLFITVQALHHLGVITINWHAVNKSAAQLLGKQNSG
jgi:uncharacterized membrane protein (Fun14 family)